MDNAQKAIMIGVGLFITILVIAAVMTITNLGINVVDQGKSQVTNLSASMQQQLVADYDGTTLTGQEVLDGIQKYYKSDNVVVYLANNGNNAISR